MIFDKYDKCYKEGVEIGFIRKDEQCSGEFTHPNKIKVDCLKCPYLNTRTARKEYEKKLRG